jgi:geranylgeranyl reductase family protein
MYDVIVSGSGPAGSKCAEMFAKKGFKVALLERDTRWRKPCGGGCSVRLFKYYPQLKNLNIINKHSIAMYSADFTEFEYTYENFNEYSFVMDRLELDNLMRDVAVDAGAQLFDKNLAFDFVTKQGEKVGVKTKTSTGEKEYLAKIIIIADGMSSKLALKSGLRSAWKTQDLGLAKCAILEGKNNFEVNKVYFYFQPYIGYGWIFPITEKKFNVGVITFYEDNLNYNINHLFREFLKNSHIQKILPISEYKQIWSAAFPEPANGVIERGLYSKNIMMIGDAAGFVSPISGEGLHASVVSGYTAANIGIDALEKEVFSEKILRNYKLHPNIKKIIRNYKLKRNMADFFYEDKGKNLNIIFKLAQNDPQFRETVASTFLFNKIPPRDFFLRIKQT